MLQEPGYLEAVSQLGEDHLRRVSDRTFDAIVSNGDGNAISALVVGAGPVGLQLAYSLGARAMPCLVVDSTPFVGANFQGAFSLNSKNGPFDGKSRPTFGSGQGLHPLFGMPVQLGDLTGAVRPQAKYWAQTLGLNAMAAPAAIALNTDVVPEATVQANKRGGLRVELLLRHRYLDGRERFATVSADTVWLPTGLGKDRGLRARDFVTASGALSWDPDGILRHQRPGEPTALTGRQFLTWLQQRGDSGSLFRVATGEQNPLPLVVVGFGNTAESVLLARQQLGPPAQNGRARPVVWLTGKNGPGSCEQYLELARPQYQPASDGLGTVVEAAVRSGGVSAVPAAAVGALAGDDGTWLVLFEGSDGRLQGQEAHAVVACTGQRTPSFTETLTALGLDVGAGFVMGTIPGSLDNQARRLGMQALSAEGRLPIFSAGVAARDDRGEGLVGEDEKLPALSVTLPPERQRRQRFALSKLNEVALANHLPRVPALVQGLFGPLPTRSFPATENWLPTPGTVDPAPRFRWANPLRQARVPPRRAIPSINLATSISDPALPEAAARSIEAAWAGIRFPSWLPRRGRQTLRLIPEAGGPEGPALRLQGASSLRRNAMAELLSGNDSVRAIINRLSMGEVALEVSFVLQGNPDGSRSYLIQPGSLRVTPQD